jgi:hypothetical protein
VQHWKDINVPESVFLRILRRNFSVCSLSKTFTTISVVETEKHIDDTNLTIGQLPNHYFATHDRFSLGLSQ